MFEVVPTPWTPAGGRSQQDAVTSVVTRWSGADRSGRSRPGWSALRPGEVEGGAGPGGEAFGFGGGLAADPGGEPGERLDGDRQPASHWSGRVKQTRCPSLGPKHSFPREAAGLSIEPQPLRSFPPSSGEPVRRATSAASASRDST
jgi:hypothetical protein